MNITIDFEIGTVDRNPVWCEKAEVKTPQEGVKLIEQRMMGMQMMVGPDIGWWNIEPQEVRDLFDDNFHARMSAEEWAKAKDQLDHQRLNAGTKE